MKPLTIGANLRQRFAQVGETERRFEDPAAERTISVSERAIGKTLAWVIVSLVIASVAGQVIRFTTGHDFAGGFIPKFNLDAEDNVPTFFSALLLLTAGALLGLTAFLKMKERNRFRYHWGALSALFVGMALDEAASIHELLIAPLRGDTHASGAFHFAWVIPAIPFVAIVAISYISFLKHLPSFTRKAFLLAGALYIGGALGMEMVGGWWASSHGETNPIYMAMTTIEETMEMAGIAVLITALVTYIKVAYPTLCFRLTEQVPQSGVL